MLHREILKAAFMSVEVFVLPKGIASHMAVSLRWDRMR